MIDAGSLAKAMERTGFNQKLLASEVGISRSYVCEILAGRRTLKRNPALRKRIAATLGVPVHWIEQPNGKRS